MRQKKPVGTVAPAVDLAELAAGRLSAGNAEELMSGDYREGELFEAADLTEYDLAGCSFLECRFDAVTLTDAEFRGSRNGCPMHQMRTL